MRDNAPRTVRRALSARPVTCHIKIDRCAGALLNGYTSVVNGDSSVGVLSPTFGGLIFELLQARTTLATALTAGLAVLPAAAVASTPDLAAKTVTVTTSGFGFVGSGEWRWPSSCWLEHAASSARPICQRAPLPCGA